MDDSSPLRIVHTESSTGWGGQEIRILAEAEGMQRRGHRVQLLCPPDAQIFRAAADRGLEVTAVPIERKKLRGVLSLRDWFARNTASVINTHSSTDSWLVAFATATLGDPPPLVRTRHVSTPVSNKPSTRWLYTRATCHIVTTGEILRHQLAQSNGFALDRMTSAPTGIDLDRFVPAADRRLVRAQLGIPPDGHLVGILATLRDWKGHRYLVDAFATMNNPHSHLLIVGDGPEWGRIKEQVERLGLGSRVIMPGNQNDVTPWLQSMDVFALPSYANEGIPQALMQAMACGLPVITTSVGGILEAVTDGESGIIVPGQQVAILQGALERLRDDHPLRTRLGLAAREKALRSFGIALMLDKMERVFRDAANHR